MPRMIEMEKRTAAFVLILGLCWPATVRAEVVLEASEIDSSTVNVERVPIVAPSLQAAISDSTQIDSSGDSLEFQEVSTGSMDDIETGRRIANKLIAGAFGGLVMGSFTAIGVAASASKDCDSDNTFCGLGAALVGLFAGSISYTVGSAIGVSRSDPHDRFISALGGSVVGLIGGIGLTSVSGGTLWPSLLIGPPVIATYWSERSRKPPEIRRASVGLVPNPKGGLSAIATLRF